MESVTDNCLEFATALGLKPDADGLFIGKVGGFPVGLKLIDPAGSCLFLFQIRHWLMEDAPQLKSLTYDSRVSQLLADKKIEIEFDDRLAWLTILDADQCLAGGPISELLESVLNTFRGAGLIGDPELCHYCQKEKVSNLSTSEGKVAQICVTCLDERLKKKERGTASPTNEAVPICLMTPFASVVGALLWTAFWMAYTSLLDRLSSGAVFVPRIVMLIVMVCIGLLVGGPVGWIIKQNRKRGKTISGFAAILFGSLAVIGGEVLYLAWLIWNNYHVFSLSAALRVLPDYYANNGVIFIGTKFLAAIICVVVAYEVAMPKEPKLKF